MLNQNTSERWGGKEMAKDNGKKDEKNKKEVDGLRTIFLSGMITEEIAKDVVQALLRLQKEDPLAPIKMIIDSIGGFIDSMFAIVDTMGSVLPEIETIVVGKAMSAAATVFLCGTKGRRFMMPHSRLLFHQVFGFSFGSTSDIVINAEEQKQLQREGSLLIASRSNISIEEVEEMINRDFYVRPDKAIEKGFADGLVTTIS